MRQIISRLLKQFLRWLRRTFWIYINHLQLKIWGAAVGNGFSTNGLLFIRNYGTLVIGDNVKINSGFRYNPIGGADRTSIVVKKGATLTIGDDCQISNTAFFCAENISIGNKVFIGGDTRFYDTNFHAITLKDRLILGGNINSRPIRIKDGAFIGASVIVLKGSTIGIQSIIGAGSVVAGKEVGDNQIWAGNPARYLKNCSGS